MSPCAATTTTHTHTTHTFSCICIALRVCLNNYLVLMGHNAPKKKFIVLETIAEKCVQFYSVCRSVRSHIFTSLALKSKERKKQHTFGSFISECSSTRDTQFEKKKIKIEYNVWSFRNDTSQPKIIYIKCERNLKTKKKTKRNRNDITVFQFSERVFCSSYQRSHFVELKDLFFGYYILVLKN